ncbi:MAG: hypothetical protein EOM72_12830 [Opitutae bacterium]|nr:hypothetical protein [Opitutae bacterium]
MGTCLRGGETDPIRKDAQEAVAEAVVKRYDILWAKLDPARGSEIAVDQIRTISKQRLGRKLGALSESEAAALRRTITEMYGE